MSGVAATPEDVNNLDHSSRVNNAIKYRSPTFSGWTGEALYALGGVAGSFTQQGSLGLGIRNVHQGNLAAFYDLPKRTELYALVGYQRASGTTLDAYGNVIAATASVGDAGNGLSSPSEAVARPDA